ncbi:MAG: hypothetical protein BIFFINMI_01228 [Phycisphaerae bacterium]|nr:hypothetical protein [Phycisphaerae bacterium]
MPDRWTHVVCPHDAHFLIRRAASDLAARLEAAVVAPDAAPRDGTVRLTIESGDPAAPEAWHIARDRRRLVLTAGRPRALYRAAWDLIDRLDAGRPVESCVVRPPLREFLAIWDQLGCGYSRDSVGFDWDAHLAEAVRLGITHLECNALATPYTIQDDDPEDPYIQWNLFGPSLDQFVASDLTAGLYPPAYLRDNLNALRARVARFRAFDIEPVMLCYEPRWLPERFFARRPDLRGPRTDHPGRGTTPRYALDVDHPAALEHYEQLVARLVAAVPDLAGICIIGEDSGAGYNFTQYRYAGPNGTFRARMHTLGQRVGDFFRALGRGLDGDGAPRRLWHVCDSFEWDRELPDVLKETEPAVGILHVTPQEDFYELDGQRRATPWHGANQVHIDDVVRRHSEMVRQTGHPDLPVTAIHGWLTDPVLGVPMPWVIAEKYRNFAAAGYDRLALYGGHLPPTHTPFNANQHVARALLRDPSADADALIAALADRWAPDQADNLLAAWRLVDRAMRLWPFRPTGDHMVCTAVWYRNLYRPLIVRPDLLPPPERRCVYLHSMSVWFDVGRFHFLWEGTRRRFTAEQAAGAADRVERHLLTPLAEAGDLLRAVPGDAAADHAERVEAIRLIAARRVRELRVAALLDAYYEGRPPADRARRREDLAAFRSLVQLDITEADLLIRLVARTGGRVVLQSPRQTPFILGTDICERLAGRSAIAARELASDATRAFFEEPLVAGEWPYRGEATIPALFRGSL